MWSVSITAVAIISVASLYAWAVYRLRDLRDERAGEVELTQPMPIEGSDWELEYLLTSDYARNPS